MKIRITANGPYLVSGGVPLRVETIESAPDGSSTGYRPGRSFEAKEKYALCRCGQSANKPFCDGTHAKIGFDGTETAAREPYSELAEPLEGPQLTLDDADSLCAVARFCDGDPTVWALVERGEGEHDRSRAIAKAHACPSGRLVIRDAKTGEASEPKLEPSIALLEDAYKGLSGPAWVKGGIEIESSDGYVYEQRNRVTLCRCGASQNKPFCDAAHLESGFTDGLA
jgi:CDGSH-type Zn-finger protein